MHWPYPVLPNGKSYHPLQFKHLPWNALCRRAPPEESRTRQVRRARKRATDDILLRVELCQQRFREDLIGARLRAWSSDQISAKHLAEALQYRSLDARLSLLSASALR